MLDAKLNGNARATLTQCAVAKHTQINLVSGFFNQKH